MEDNKKDAVYTRTRSKDEIFYILKVILSFVGIVAVWLVTVKSYKTFGEMWLLPAVSIMWVMGAITSYVIAEDRESTIKETKFAILGYCLLLLVYRWVLQKVAPLTASQLGTALNISYSKTSGVAATGLLQNLLVWISLMIPIGYLIWCAQKFKVFKGRKTKEEELNKLKGFNKFRRKRD